MNARPLRLAAAFVAAVLLFTGCPQGRCKGAKCAAPPDRTPGPTAGQQWRRIADAPAPARQEVAAAVVGGKVYVIGGLLQQGATNRVDVFDPVSRSWARGPRLPIAVHHAMAAEHDGMLVVMGGFVGALGGAATDRVFILDGDRWRDGPRLRRPRGAAAAVTVEDRVIVVGGISAGNHVAPVEIFDGRTWRDGASIPTLRDHVAAATDGHFVWVAGGRRAGEHFDTFEGYDADNDRWGSGLASMPTARSGLGGVFTRGLVVTVGGEGPRIFPEVEVYDVAAGRWRAFPDLAVPVHGVGVAAIGRELYAFYGGVRVGAAPSRVVQVLEIGSGI